ncbi:pentapeptide repeat-containing protein [Streptomyces sp. NPDC048564]|uniref:pentapeptide repeat-containing protein n=1 Tax=Streptomyces sp. NPDC048564 TaxID=3155760 RepID=UPI0034403046
MGSDLLLHWIKPLRTPRVGQRMATGLFAGGRLGHSHALCVRRWLTYGPQGLRPAHTCGDRSGTLAVMPEPSESQGSNPRDTHRTLGLWSIRRALVVSVAASAALLISTWFLISWFLGSPPKADPKPLDTAAQLELLKLVFATVAGVGALVALVTSYRRQRIDEIASERAERVHAHSERVADANIHDATERRVTELYSHAVEQLGHEKATVRLGGLYSLERLAQHNDEHRQVVVEVICAYLRMPYNSPMEQDVSTETQQEWQVRRAAQEVLARHLRAEPLRSRFRGRDREASENPLYWPDVSLDLRGAVLIDANFSECSLVNPIFTEATFIGDALFSGAIFTGPASFSSCEFKGWAAFDGAEFTGNLFITSATFEGISDFRNSSFHRQLSTARVTFKGETWFTEALFHADVRFVDRRFPHAMPTFEHGIDLSGARILNQEETVMLPDGWRVDANADERTVTPSGETSAPGPRGNNRPPYPRLNQDPHPRWRIGS